jgi:hypothetical protein
MNRILSVYRNSENVIQQINDTVITLEAERYIADSLTKL